MRDIKFRVYNSRDNKMHFDITGFEFCNGDMTGVFIDGVFFSKEEVFIMQYTGQKNKNGKEIYEGDIISNGCEKCIVVWAKECAGFMLKLINKQYEDKEWTNPIIDLTKNDEVIGNIYENPELLEDK